MLKWHSILTPFLDSTRLRKRSWLTKDLGLSRNSVFEAVEGLEVVHALEVESDLGQRHATRAALQLKLGNELTVGAVLMFVGFKDTRGDVFDQFR